MRFLRNGRRGVPNGALLLLAASLLAMAGAAWQAERAWRAERARLEAAVRGYTAFVAWSFGGHVDEAITRGMWDILNPVNHADGVHTSPRIPPASELAHYLRWDSAGCYCHQTGLAPSAFVALTLGTDTIAIAPNVYAGPTRGGVLVDEDAARAHGLPVLEREAVARHAVPENERAALLARLTRDARKRYDPRSRMAILTRATSAGPSLIGYTVMPTVWGDTLVYALIYDAERTRRLFDDVLDGEDLLPPSIAGGRANRDLVRADVRDGDGRLIYSTAPGPDPAAAAEQPLGDRLSWMHVRADVKPEMARALVAAGLPGSPLPLLLGLLGLAAVLALTALGQMRRAAQLSRARTDFVSSVSHELRTPLAQIRLYLETLRLGRFRTDEQRERALETIDRETGRLASLVDNVLAFERAGRGGIAAPVERVDAGDEVAAAVAAFRPLAASRGATVELDRAGDSTVVGAPEQLRQVLTNLLDNALKYGPAGQTVRVGVARSDGRVRVTVEDEGPGVPAGERGRVWDAFWRGHGATATAVAGSGIGLSVVREIVRRHGGSVFVEDGARGGARFGFDLPAA